MNADIEVVELVSWNLEKFDESYLMYIEYMYIPQQPPTPTPTPKKPPKPQFRKIDDNETVIISNLKVDIIV